jgi:hypothetical protein
MLRDSAKWQREGLLRNFFRILVPVAFFFYAFHVINPEDVAFAFRKAELVWFFMGSACILLANYLCALRTRSLLGNKKQSLYRLHAVHTLSSLIAGMLPFQTGELSFAYYLRKYFDVPVNEGMAILVSVRVVEYFMFLVLIFFLSSLGIFIEPSSLSLSVFSLIGINLVLVLMVIWNANIFYRPLKYLTQSGLGFLFGRSGIDSVFEKADRFSQDIKIAFSHNLSVKLLPLTFVIVLLRQTFTLAMLRSMDVKISLWLIVLLFSFLYVAKFIQGFGSFGTQEAGISAALVLTGQTQVEALPVAIGTHLLQWAPILFFGCIAYLILRFDGAHKLV